MSMLPHRRSAGPVTDLFEWLDALSPFRGVAPEESLIRVEEFLEDGKYVVRADMPGVDPDQDIVVSVDNDVLTIRGERRQEQHDKHRSEVRYGSFSRQLALPKGSAGEGVRAHYSAGVLEVVVPIAKEAESEPTRIPVERADD